MPQKQTFIITSVKMAKRRKKQPLAKGIGSVRQYCADELEAVGLV